MVKPSVLTIPNCQITATKEQMVTVIALRKQRVSNSSSTAIKARVKKKNMATSSAAAITSPAF